MKETFYTIENVKFHIMRIHVSETIEYLKRPLGQFGEQ